jgi:hypothetical protein
MSNLTDQSIIDLIHGMRNEINQLFFIFSLIIQGGVNNNINSDLSILPEELLRKFR